MKSGKGFTLLEILAASVLISLIAVAMISSFESGTYLLMEARQRMEAGLIAQAEFERLINLAKTSAGYNSIIAGNINVPSYYKLNKWLTSATYSALSFPGNNYKKIEIIICWNFRNKNFEERFLTFVFNPENFVK